MSCRRLVQYAVIAPALGAVECAGFANRLLTAIGFVHICYQPYVVMVYYEYKAQDVAAILCSPNEDFGRPRKHSGTHFQSNFHINVAQIEYSRM